MPTDPPPAACDLSALGDPEQHRADAASLFEARTGTDELEDGVALRYPLGSDWTRRLAAFVAEEQQCCPFFRFEVIVDPEAEATWLRLRGDERAQSMLDDVLMS